MNARFFLTHLVEWEVDLFDESHLKILSLLYRLDRLSKRTIFLSLSARELLSYVVPIARV